MDINKHFLEVDKPKANAHYSCFKDCLKSVSKHVEKGEIDLAKHRATDMLMSLQVLSNLNFKKRNKDRKDDPAALMVKKGIGIEEVKEHFHD